MQVLYYDNQPKITHNRSNTQWHSNSHKSNNTPLAHTTRQSASSSLRATWLTVSSPALTVPAVNNAPSTDAEHSLRSANVDDLCRRPALTISAVDTAPSTDVKRSLTLPRTTNVDDLCRRPALTISAVDTTLSTDVKRSLTLLQTTSVRRSPAMSSVRYLSIARSSLIYCPTAQTTKKGHHVVLSFAGHTCSRLPDNGRSPVIRDAALSEVVHAWRRAVWSRSPVTSHCLVAIFRHCLSDQTPPGTATSPSIADCCGLLAPTMTHEDKLKSKVLELSSSRSESPVQN